MNLMIAPAKMYEINGNVSPILTAPASVGVGNGTLVTGISGKRIRVHGWSAQTDSSSGVPGTFILTDGSGGAALCRLHYAPIYTAVPMLEKPFIHAGYFETTAGTGLGITVGVANVKIDVHYSVYTP